MLKWYDFEFFKVEGTPVPPPARKVILEKLPDQPPKPQNILIEKWLPYKQRSRRVVYERSCVPPPPNPRNLVIEWEQPEVQIEQQCINLGVCNANPEEYIRQFGCELKQPCEIPDICQTCPPAPAPVCCPAPVVQVEVNPCNPCCEPAAVVCQAPQVTTYTTQTTACPLPLQPVRRLFRSSSVSSFVVRSAAPARLSSNVQLVGDSDALRLVDLEANGLAEYRRFL
jgi:hypothetical protein